MEPALRIAHLSHSYGRGRPVLRDVALSLPSGAWKGLIGPNGAGKTTLIRAICGLIQPDRGSILLSGEPNDRERRHRELGIIPQELALYETLTLKANLSAFGRFHGLSGRRLRQSVQWALDWIGLKARANDRVGDFSGGMKRRVNLACGVLHKPKIIILDEPTVGVDPQSRERIFAMLDELRRGGTAILMTTHHLDEVERHCDAIAILDQGRILAEGKLADLIRQTVGQRKLVSVACPVPPQVALGRWTWNAETQRLSTQVDDASGSLPALLAEIESWRPDLDDLQVVSPTLHHVFVHLTGRQLRE